MRRYWRNATQAPLATALALLAVSSGVRTVFDPESLPVYDQLGDLAYLWAAMFTLGGLGMLYGMTTLKTRFEAAGCVLFAGGAAVEALTFVAVLGVGFASIYSVINLGVFAFFALVRAYRLVHGEHLVWVRVSK